jgi:hypothetical protein
MENKLMSENNVDKDFVLETFGKLNLAPKSPEELTKERGQTHGRFVDHANYTQAFKRLMYKAEQERVHRGQPPLNNMQREALEMIFHKIGRIFAGEASFQDHWNDIAGYAHLPDKEF